MKKSAQLELLKVCKDTETHLRGIARELGVFPATQQSLRQIARDLREAISKATGK